MQTGEIIGIIIGVLLVEVITHFLTVESLDIVFYTPRSIYEESNMNWFGTICIYILIFPFSFILGIGGFLRWLVTVGRKQSNDN